MIDEIKKAVEVLRRSETQYIPEDEPMNYKQAWDIVLALAEDYIKASEILPEKYKFDDVPVLMDSSSRELHEEYKKRETHNAVVDACRLALLKKLEGITPERLHELYLEATKTLQPKNYNPEAQKKYCDLTEELRFIDFHIAESIRRAILK